MAIALQVTRGAQDAEATFAVLFSAVESPGGSDSLDAVLEFGDGERQQIANLTAPSAYAWREQRSSLLGSHTYSRPGTYDCVLTWGSERVQAAWSSPASLAAPASAPAAEVEATIFEVAADDSSALVRRVRIAIRGLATGLQARLDSGAGKIVLLGEHDFSGSDQVFESRLTYGKPGRYQVALDLLDPQGFWLSTLGELPLDVTLADSADSEVREVGGDGAPGDTPGTGAVSAQPWNPYRYARPMWNQARTYKTPGGSVVSRVLSLGTYLSVRDEQTIGGTVWFSTARRDWVSGDALEELIPSDLRGVVLGQTASEPKRSPVQPGARKAVVIAPVLNVRAEPGILAENPPVDQVNAGSELQVLEERQVGSALWCRIGVDRWVHGSQLRFLASERRVGAGEPRGVVLAAMLNVRARPGVAAANPVVDQLRAGGEVTILEEKVQGRQVWYRIGTERWVQASHIQRVEPGRVVAGSPAPVAALPLGWCSADSANVQAAAGDAGAAPALDTLFHYDVVPVLESTRVGTASWYRIGDGRWVEGAKISVARPVARPHTISAGARWVAVSLVEQTLVAYEGDRPVYAALVSSGIQTSPTVKGVFKTYQRTPVGKMTGGSPASGSYYYLEDVTWTCYFYGGYSLHCAYWHDNFGTPRSHGCVNLTPYDSWWLYQWSAEGATGSPVVYVF
jgi:hypothetical protein